MVNGVCSLQHARVRMRPRPRGAPAPRTTGTPRSGRGGGTGAQDQVPSYIHSLAAALATGGTSPEPPVSVPGEDPAQDPDGRPKGQDDRRSDSVGDESQGRRADEAVEEASHDALPSQSVQLVAIDSYLTIGGGPEANPLTACFDFVSERRLAELYAVLA